MHKSPFIFLLLFCTLTSFPSFANLSLSDHRLYFDSANKSASLGIRNRSNKSLKFSIEISHKDMAESGILFTVEEQQVTDRSAKKMLRYSPRRGIIKANELQAIRFRLRKPAGLTPGEYRAVLKITSEVPQNPQAEGISINPKFAYSLPIIVRHGKLEVSSSLENPQLIMQNSQPTLQFWQTISGNRSLFGDFIIHDKDKQEVGRLNSVAVYLPLTRRKVNIALSADAQGELTISYQEQRKYGGNIELKTHININ